MTQHQIRATYMWTTLNYPEGGTDTQQDLEPCWKDIKF